MRRKALALAVALLASPIPAHSQYNWDAELSVCDRWDTGTCIYVQALARGTDLTIFTGSGGPGFIGFLDLSWFPVSATLVSSSTSETPWVSRGGLTLDYVGDVDEYTAGLNGFNGPEEIALRLDTPVHVRDAYLYGLALVFLEADRASWCDDEPYNSNCRHYYMGQPTGDALITQVTPEPGTWLLLGTGLLGLGFVARRQRGEVHPT